MSKHRRPTGNPRRTALSFVALAVVALSTAVLAGPAAAAKGGPNADSLELVILGATSRTADSALVANHGDDVTFDVTTAVDRPFVGLRCWQGEDFVYDAYVGYFPDYHNDAPWFTLDSLYWTEGLDANCTARLLHWNRQGREIVLATTSFSVAG